MKDFNKVSLFFLKLLEILFLVFFFVFLVFIAKWRIDRLYANAINNGKANFKVSDEYNKSKTEVLNLMGKTDEKYEMPVVKEKQEEPDKKESILINVPASTDVNQLGEILLNNNLITSTQEYKRLMDEMGLNNKILPGNYEIKEGMKAKEILADICGTEIHDVTFTIEEGASARDVGNLLVHLEMIESATAFVDKCNEMGRTQFVPGEHKITMPLKVAKIIEQITV